MTQVLLSVGSNQNNPQAQILAAFDALEQYHGQVKFSKLYLTEPVSDIPQNPYINAAIVLHTDLSSTEFLQQILELEKTAGRDRSLELLKGPRNLDIDIILFGDEILNSEELNIPHPRFRDRLFVLKPAAEIAGEMLDPVSGTSISHILSRCQDTNWVKTLEEEVMA